MKGLKPKIRAKVRALKPNGLGPLMKAAQLVEKNLAIRSIRETPGLKQPKPNPNGRQETGRSSEAFSTKVVSLGERSTQPVRAYPRRRLNLTEAEVQARGEKGFCFHYDEKFSLGHRCKREL